MIRKQKSIVVIMCLLLAILIFGVTGCSAGKNNSSIQSSGKEKTSSTASEKPEESSADESTASVSQIKAEDFSATMYPRIDLNVRTGPGTQYPVIGEVRKNTQVKITGKCENGWYRVDYDGKEGCCYAAYFSAEKVSETTSAAESKPYYIKVNLTQNIVTVYSKDKSGNYTVPFKAMTCSVGREGKTPVGTWNTSGKFRWARLSGNVYGQYATRITGPYLFHSVPYFTQNNGDIEYEEYNKLGSAASLGCVRLCVRDVKWIYDNCPAGTTVTTYYSDAPEPITPPAPVRIDINDSRRGWDPTDPDPNNPWQ